MNDEDLVIAAQNGDDEAFYKLILSHKDKLNEPKYFSTWLTKIMINYCIDEQKIKKKVVYIEEQQREDASNTDNSMDNLTLEDAIEKLDPKYKEVIILKYIQDMTIIDISKVMECPEGTIKTWITRALKQLKDLLNLGGDFNV